MKELTEHEALFCRYYVQTNSPREAAARAGYWVNPERSGLKLMSKKEVNSEIERLNQQRATLTQAAAGGLSRLAFGSIADAVRLMRRWEELSDEEIETLDLFCVSELKQSKGGGLEMKFHDRMEALHELRELSGKQETEGASAFYRALEQGAAALRESSGAE